MFTENCNHSISWHGYIFEPLISMLPSFQECSLKLSHKISQLFLPYNQFLFAWNQQHIQIAFEVNTNQNAKISLMLSTCVHNVKFQYCFPCSKPISGDSQQDYCNIPSLYRYKYFFLQTAVPITNILCTNSNIQLSQNQFNFNIQYMSPSLTISVLLLRDPT